MNESDLADPLAQSYEESAAAGSQFIKQTWGRLSDRTKSWLVNSKYYTQHGGRQEVSGEDSSDEVESFEYNLGVLKRCVNSSLPRRGEPDGIVPREALSEQVLSSAGEILSEKHLEPDSLRLALQAVGKYELANLLTRLPPVREDHPLSNGIARLLLGVLAIGLVLASPFILGTTLVSSMRGDAGGTIVALYGLGITAMLVWEMKNFSEREQKP